MPRLFNQKLVVYKLNMYLGMAEYIWWLGANRGRYKGKGCWGGCGHGSEGDGGCRRGGGGARGEATLSLKWSLIIFNFNVVVHDHFHQNDF
jgi:hypothetical protein